MNRELTADELAEYLNGCEAFKVAASFGKLEVSIQRLSDNAPPIVRICYKHQLAVDARQAIGLQLDLAKATAYALGVEQLLEKTLDRECPGPGELADANLVVGCTVRVSCPACPPIVPFAATYTAQVSYVHPVSDTRRAKGYGHTTVELEGTGDNPSSVYAGGTLYHSPTVVVIADFHGRAVDEPSPG